MDGGLTKRQGKQTTFVLVEQGHKTLHSWVTFLLEGEPLIKRSHTRN